jgi:hypothetical protein
LATLIGEAWIGFSIVAEPKVSIAARAFQSRPLIASGDIKNLSDYRFPALGANLRN